MKKLLFFFALLPSLLFGQITLTNSDNNIKAVNSGVTEYIAIKSQVSVKLEGTRTKVNFFAGGQISYSFLYSEIDSPVTSSISVLMDTLNVWIGESVNVITDSEGGLLSRIVVDSDPYTMDGDTAYIWELEGHYFFSLHFVSSGLDQTDGSVKMQISTDGTNYIDYPSDSLLFNAAAVSGYIRDTEKGILATHLKALIDSGTCTAGTVTIDGIISKK